MLNDRFGFRGVDFARILERSLNYVIGTSWVLILAMSIGKYDVMCTVAHKDKTLPRIQKHFPESKTLPRIQNDFPESGFWKVFLNSRKCFEFWEVFLDSRKCFGFWKVFLDSGKCFVLTSHRRCALKADPASRFLRYI